MAELALGIVGVVPVAASAFKSIKSLYKKLETFRQYTREAVRAQHELEVQEAIFRNEWRFLKNLLPPNGAKRDAAANASSEKSRQLDRSLRDSLGSNYAVCERAISMIGEDLETLAAEIQSLYLLAKPTKQQEGENASKVEEKSRELRDRLNVVFKKGSWNETIEKLRRSINNLSTLRKQVETMEKREDHKVVIKGKPSQMQYLTEWRVSTNIQRASKALYHALVDAWKCGQSHHTRHQFRLYVASSHADEETRLQMAILYDQQHQMLLRNKAAPVHLDVRSLTIASTVGMGGKELTPPGDLDQRPPKRSKCVRFAEEPRATACSIQRLVKDETHSTSDSQQQQNGPFSQISRDLRCSQDICVELAGQAMAGGCCLGHIEMMKQDGGFRHSFFPACLEGGQLGGFVFQEPVTLDHLISKYRRNLINPLDKLRVARALVLSLLQFYSTPWLKDIWELRQLSMFVEDVEDLSRTLKSLHLSTEFGQIPVRRPDEVPGDVQMVTAPNSQDEDDDDGRDDEEIRCNIRSRPLWSLGVAMLQIDHWMKVDLTDALAVRKTAALPSHISPKYRELTQMCLECDFGRRHGRDLSKTMLQQAVYKVLVGEIDRLIALKQEEMKPVRVSDEDDDGYE